MLLYFRLPKSQVAVPRSTVKPPRDPAGALIDKLAFRGFVLRACPLRAATLMHSQSLALSLLLRFPDRAARSAVRVLTGLFRRLEAVAARCNADSWAVL